MTGTRGLVIGVLCSAIVATGMLAQAECCIRPGSWDTPGFSKRYQRSYNPFAGGSEPDNPVTWPNDINSAFNPINKYDPGNPANPLNRYDPLNPLNPVNKYDPENARTWRHSSDVPFAPLR